MTSSGPDGKRARPAMKRRVLVFVPPAPWVRAGCSKSNPTCPTACVCVPAAQGKYDKALSFYEESLSIKRKTLEADHPKIAVSLNNIGNI